MLFSLLLRRSIETVMKLEFCTPTNPISVLKMAQQVPLVVHTTQSQLHRKYLAFAETTSKLFRPLED